MRVADFFAEYIKGPERTERIVKKLKDWPAYTEFREKFPDLYDDFHQAMPVPDYTRRDGVLNISAHVGRLWVFARAARADSSALPVPSSPRST